MIENTEHLNNPKMTYYKETYKDSPHWQGQPGTLLIYCEQGIGDTIQFSRYFKYTGCRTLLHCPKNLHKLMKTIADEVYDKDEPNLPPHDFHCRTFSLPFILQRIDADIPYIHVPPIGLGVGFKIGIACDVNPENAKNRQCPADLLKPLEQFGRVYNLQELACDDFYDTARYVAAMDVIVSVDTAVLHLAGAMGKRTLGMLCSEADARWDVGVNWYPSVQFFRQKDLGDWEPVIDSLITVLTKDIQFPSAD